jgi:hypothetical protein
MIRPTKHPKSGVYRLRLAVPAPLRGITALLCGRHAELIENLQTKDPGWGNAPEAIGRPTRTPGGFLRLS